MVSNLIWLIECGKILKQNKTSWDCIENTVLLFFFFNFFFKVFLFLRGRVSGFLTSRGISVSSQHGIELVQ